MLNFRQRTLLQNLINFRKMQLATVAYQFKVDRPVYYPDRDSETQRVGDQPKNQLVTETQMKKQLPKDYYYKVLGIRKLATTQQIKAAYYALAKRFHPDASNTSQETQKFQEILNAYHILTDETKRLEYDQLGAVKDEVNFLKNISNFSIPNKMDYPFPTTREELVRITNGEHLLELTFIEAAHGVKKSLDMRFLKKCPTCNGKSPKQVSRTNSELCRKCNGTGQLTKKTPTYTSLLVCDQCQGKRYINRNQCDTCDNRGIVLETTKVNVSVPAGVKTGDILPIANPATKHRVNYRVHVGESDYFRREGNDILTDRYLSISEAILGGVFKVRGLFEDMDVKLEPGVESHSQVVLKGKGIKSRDNQGNHIVTFKVRIPRTLSTKQRQLILALAKTEEHYFQRSG